MSGAGSYSHWAEKLIGINIAIFFFSKVIADDKGAKWIIDYLGLIPASVLKGYVWQLFSYMFLHANFWHIFFNMYALLVFGVPIERTWGSKRFLQYYFITGIGAGLTIFLINGFILGGVFSEIPTIGASGAIFGLLLAFGVLFPDSIIIFFVIPLKAKYLVVLYGVITMWALVSDNASGVSHAGHLGGMVFGIIYFVYYGKIGKPLRKANYRLRQNKEIRKHERTRDDEAKNTALLMTDILKKLKSGGTEALSDDEFQKVRYMLIMNENMPSGICSEKDFNIEDGYCLECDHLQACIARALKSYFNKQ